MPDPVLTIQNAGSTFPSLLINGIAVTLRKYDEGGNTVLLPDALYTVTVDGTDFDVPQLLGDFDGNGFCNNNDVTTFRAAYGSTPSDPNWNPCCDFDGDGVVGDPDKAVMESQFGKHVS